MGVPKFKSLPPETGRFSERPSTIRPKFYAAKPLTSKYYPALDKKLLESVRECNPESVKILIAGGANANVLDGSGKSALKIAAASGNRETTEILIDNGASLSYKNEFGSVLFDAIFSTNSEVAAIILFAGADPNEKLENGTTPLMIAVRLGLYDVAEILLTCGADRTAEDYCGRTAMDFARDKKMIAILEKNQ